MKNKNAAAILLILFFAFLFSLRFIHLGADPPRDLDTTSMGFIGDPGGYVINARNKVVFGKWEMDEWNPMHISPLPHFLTYCIFLFFDVGVARMNLLPVLFSCLLLVCAYQILRKTYDRAFAFLGTLLLGMNFHFTMFSRIAVRTIEMVFFVVLALYLLILARNEKKKAWAVFAAGAVCFIAFTVKGTFLLILPSVFGGLLLYAFFQSRKKIKPALFTIILFLLGIASVFILWLLFFYFPHKELFLSFGTENFNWLFPRGFAEGLTNFWGRPLYYFLNMPLVTTLAGISLLVLVYRALTSPEKLSLPDWVGGFWVISTMVYFSVIYYRSSRHFVSMVIPLVFLATSLLHKIRRCPAIRKPHKIPLLFFPFLFLWLIFPLNSLFILMSRPVLPADIRAKSYLVAVLALGITLAVFLLYKLWPLSFNVRLPHRLKTAVIIMLVLSSCVIDANSYLNWALHPRFDVRNISRDFGQAFERMNLAGLLAPVVSLENRHEAHAYYTDYINKGKDFIRKYGITHIFITTNNALEKVLYERDFPEVMEKAKLLARYPLWKTHVELYEVGPPAGPTRTEGDVYEGEIFFGEKSIPRYDPEASGKLAYFIERSKTGTQIILPRLAYPAGRYLAAFHLKGEDDLSWAQPVARIEVAERRGKKPIVFKNVHGRDLSPDGTYQPVSLAITLQQPTSIILRLHSTGKATLWLDRVVLKKLEP